MSAAMSALDAPVMILAGGTGGHIFPGLAVARALRDMRVPVLWLGADGGMETRLVPANDFPIETIAVRGLRGKGLASTLGAPFVVLRSLLQAIGVLRRVQPRAVISFGGFAAGPGGLAAWLLRRPLIVHEQNRAPGLTNRVLARVARRVLCGFPDSFAGVRERNRRQSGAPGDRRIAAAGRALRRTQRPAAPARARRQPGRARDQCAVPKVIASLQAEHEFKIVHQCGEQDARRSRAAPTTKPASARRIEAFIDDMAAAYGWADLVICRAGALTIAELCAAGVPSILMPFPGAVDDHQARNAEFLAERGGGSWMRQDDAPRSRRCAKACARSPAIAAACWRWPKRRARSVLPECRASRGRHCPAGGPRMMRRRLMGSGTWPALSRACTSSASAAPA